MRTANRAYPNKLEDIIEEDGLINIENTPTIGHPGDSYSSSKHIGSQ